MGLPTHDSIIYEDEYVFVTPDLAPVCLGHYLIVSKKHVNSFGNSDFDAYASMKKAAMFVRQNCYGGKSSLLFEHGAVIPNTAGASIDHAHLHSIPDNGIRMDDLLLASSTPLPEKMEASYLTLAAFAKSKQPYIYYSDSSGEWVRPVEHLPHQFFRHILSFKDGCNYDWKVSYTSEISARLFRESLALFRL